MNAVGYWRFKEGLPLREVSPMTESSITESSPGGALFPEYEPLYDLIAAEVTGLTDARLRFRIGQVGVERVEHSTQRLFTNASLLGLASHPATGPAESHASTIFRTHSGGFPLHP